MRKKFRQNKGNDMKFVAIKEHHLYNKAYRQGNRFVGRYVAVYVLRDYAAKKLMMAHPKKQYVNRIGLSVTKKVGGACVRTRAKRIIREGLRAVMRERALKTGFLVVIAARSEIVGKKMQDVENELRLAFDKLGFFKTNA
ncbi:MAG: ribonuclease P protein component [Clostridia bacterium]|nr:ribonuclease P protein component [Clostridia bacterium]